MKTLKTLLAAAALVMMTCAVFAQEEAAPEAEDSTEISYGVSGGVFSMNASRGDVVSNQPVFQFEGWVTMGPLTLNVWNNMDLTDDNFSAGDITETDVTVEYAFALPSVDCALGYIYYTFPHWGVDDTQELYGTATVDCFLSPSVELYWDLDEIGGIYAVGGVSHSFELPLTVGDENLSLDLSAAVGYGDSNYIAGCFATTGSSWVDLLVTAEVPIDLGNGLSLTPSVAYQQVLDTDVRQCTGDSDTVFAGLTLTKEL